MELSHLVLVGVILQFLGGASYAFLTLRGQTKPNRMTWFLWSVAPLIGTAAAVSDGVGWAILPVFMAGFVPLLVFTASFVNKQSYWQLTKFDYYCGAVSVLALVLWGVTQLPLVAIFFAATADGLAALPTLVKAWKYPETESSIAYITTFVAVALGLFTVAEWRPSEYLFSVYLLVITAAITFAIHRKQIFRS